MQVARDMGISRNAAAHRVQLATRPRIQCTRGTGCACPECLYQGFQDESEAKIRKRLFQLLKTDGYYSNLNLDDFFRFFS